MQHSVTPCIHEINEYKQNRFNTFGNKFCKNFSHYKFLVQFVFAPHFKQRHIPCYNITTTTEKPTWNDPGTWCMCESKNCEILLFPTADKRFDTKFKCPTRRASFWVKFPTERSLTWVKCPGIAREGHGRFWNWLVHYATGWLVDSGRMTRKCRVRLGMHSLARHFFVMLPSWTFQPSCCLSSQISWNKERWY